MNDSISMEIMFIPWIHDKILLIVISFLLGIVFDRLVRIWAIQYHVTKRPSSSSNRPTAEYQPYSWNHELSSMKDSDIQSSSDDSISLNMYPDREDIHSSNSSSTSCDVTMTDLRLHTRDLMTISPCTDVPLSNENENETDMDPPRMNHEWSILHGAIKLCFQQWEKDYGRKHNIQQIHGCDNHQSSTTTATQDNTKVVHFLTPQQVISTLFTPSSDIHIENNNNNNNNNINDEIIHDTHSNSLDKTLSLRRRRRRKHIVSKSSTITTTTTTCSSQQSRDEQHQHQQQQKQQQDDEYYPIPIQSMLHIFQQIQKYSVHTSHPYFFNQMFGTLDPIALAAELIAQSVHTSVYTFETAPIFTMIEREVISTLGRLIFHQQDEYVEEEEVVDPTMKYLEQDISYDGLMLPGGSISNLTALHVARYMTTKALLQHEKDEMMKFHSDVSMDVSQQQVQDYPTNLVAFVSQEAHYSFSKAVAITGLGLSNLIIVPTLDHGPMDIQALDELIGKARQEGKIPFFVAVTAGSTVRGSFDDIEGISKVCYKHEQHRNYYPKIWIHVDGAWGGTAIFSKRPEIYNLVRGVHQVDSFTFNPHKMLGASQQTTAFVTRHNGIMKESNALGAKYLFDNRRVGASFDLGDNIFTCGRRSDAIKLWAMWKYYGSDGLGTMVDSRVDFLSKFTLAIQDHDAFILACEPWPFNVNFFYIPHRLRSMVEINGVDVKSRNPNIPDDVSMELGKVSVQLKLRLQQSGEMLIPYQPLSSQQGECFRLVIAGNKTLEEGDIVKIMNLMDKYGYDL